MTRDFETAGFFFYFPELFSKYPELSNISLFFAVNLHFSEKFLSERVFFSLRNVHRTVYRRYSRSTEPKFVYAKIEMKKYR